MLVVVPISGIALHADLLATVLAAFFPFISRVDTGHLLNRFNQDLMFVDTTLPMALFNTSAELFTGLVQIILIALASVHALSVIPPLFAVLYMIQRFYLRTSKQLRLLELETKADLHTRLSELAAGITTIRAHGWAAFAEQRFAESLDRSQESFYLLYAVQRWLQLVLGLVVAGLVLIVTGVAVRLNMGPGGAAVGAIGVALTNATSLGETLTNLIVSWTSLETALGAVARIALFKRDTPREIAGNDTREPLPDDWSRKGVIEFVNVWASYTTAGDGAPQDNNNTNSQGGPWGLKGISATFDAGAKVAICGSTGSGKSTMLLAILGMIDVKVGYVAIDGVPISQLAPAEFRQRFEVISQDYFSCARTIREELDPDGQFSDEEICDALRECGLWDKICAMTSLDGLRSELSLSNGESQLLCLAGVILRSKRQPGGILLLDEATSRYAQALLS